MIACDLGSNTLRIVELDCEDGRRIREFERMVKTADGLHESGLISPQSVERIVTALQEAGELFDLSLAHAVTTAAMRMATNRAEVLETIYEKTGVRFVCIDAKEEARLTRLAVSWRLEKMGYHDSFMLMDLGGGSTEISLDDASQSFDVGIVTMAQRCGSKEMVERSLETILEPITRYLKAVDHPPLFVATAGTPTTIAAFKQDLDYAHYDVEKVNGTTLTLLDLDAALSRLLAMDIKERERYVGVGRDSLIVAGVLMVKHIMIAAGYERMLVIDDGLREGVALEKCAEDNFSA